MVNMCYWHYHHLLVKCSIPEQIELLFKFQAVRSTGDNISATATEHSMKIPILIPFIAELVVILTIYE